MDELTRPGIEPFVQAGFMPQALSSKPEPYTPTLVKTGLPRDMVSVGRKWEALIEALARHSGERYGKERASSWSCGMSSDRLLLRDSYRGNR